jgi:glutamyl-tRNA reductase
LSEVICLGVSFKTAPVALRERLAMSDTRARAFLAEATAHETITEAAIISTCNRTELYVVSANPVAAESAMLGLLAQTAQIRPTQLTELLYAPRNCDAARHL